MDHFDQSVRKEFQLERLIFFSDAVFAIAITLLIIDIRIPYQDGFTDKLLLQAIGQKVPQLMGFFISFFFIGGYWIIHHKLYGYVRRFDTRLIWLNLFFLLSIVLLPFTTSIFGMYGNLLAAFTVYIFNAIFTGIMNFLCWKHILNPHKKLSAGTEGPTFHRAAYARSLAMPVWFFICWIIAVFTSAPIGEFCLPLIAVVFIVIGKKFKGTQPESKERQDIEEG